MACSCVMSLLVLLSVTLEVHAFMDTAFLDPHPKTIYHVKRKQKQGPPPQSERTSLHISESDTTVDTSGTMTARKSKDPFQDLDALRDKIHKAEKFSPRHAKAPRHIKKHVAEVSSFLPVVFHPEAGCGSRVSMKSMGVSLTQHSTEVWKGSIVPKDVSALQRSSTAATRPPNVEGCNEFGADHYCYVVNGLCFTWVSPCSGGCDTVELGQTSDWCPGGIRKATEEEWNGAIDVLNANKLDFYNKCSAKCWNARHHHCDRSNTLMRDFDGGYQEMVFICDKYKGQKAMAVEHPGRNSFSKPGSGSVQVLKSEGESTIGTINGIEPYVSVLKDGYYEVGCLADAMAGSADKYGNGKFKYKNTFNISIVRYDEIVLSDSQEAMTPRICYEFCRTIPNMIYFGIENGRDCYCTPYYQKMPLDDSKCDAPCEGDTTVMCGSKTKSTIWEMHLCADTSENLADAMTESKEALDYFYEQALLGSDLGGKMATSGAALEKAAGLAGAPSAADMGMAAKKASKAPAQTYKQSMDMYNKLASAYADAAALDKADFSQAASQTKAEHATNTMKELTGKVLVKAQELFELNKLAYPAISTLLGEEPDPSDGVGVALADDTGNFDYRPAAYSIDSGFAPGLSSCTGTTIGLPMVGLSTTGCGTACSATVYPEKCVGFNYYTTGDGDGLCFLLSSVKDLTTFECDVSETCLPTELQPPKAVCSPSALCMIKLSEITTGFKPSGSWEKTDRCFGEPEGMGGFTAYEMPEPSPGLSKDFKVRIV